MDINVMILIGLTLLCATIIIYKFLFPKCRHLWSFMDKHDIVITNYNTGQKTNQTTQLLTCKSCGKIVRLNLTTGEERVIVRGGTIQKDTINI